MTRTTGQQEKNLVVLKRAAIAALAIIATVMLVVVLVPSGNSSSTHKASGANITVTQRADDKAAWAQIEALRNTARIRYSTAEAMCANQYEAKNLSDAIGYRFKMINDKTTAAWRAVAAERANIDWVDVERVCGYAMYGDNYDPTTATGIPVPGQ